MPIGPPIRGVVLYPPSLRRPVTLVSERDEYRVADMGSLYEVQARAAVDAGHRLNHRLVDVPLSNLAEPIVATDTPSVWRALAVPASRVTDVVLPSSREMRAVLSTAAS